MMTFFSSHDKQAIRQQVQQELRKLMASLRQLELYKHPTKPTAFFTSHPNPYSPLHEALENIHESLHHVEGNTSSSLPKISTS